MCDLLFFASVSPAKSLPRQREKRPVAQITTRERRQRNLIAAQEDLLRDSSQPIKGNLTKKRKHCGEITAPKRVLSVINISYLASLLCKKPREKIAPVVCDCCISQPAQ